MTNPVSPAPWMQEMLQQGLNALNRGDAEKATDCALRVLGVKQDLPAAHFLIGLIALQGQKKWPAIDAFSNVVKLDPHNCAAWGHLAEIYTAVGQPENAEKALQQAIEQEDGTPNVQHLIAMVLSLLGDNEAALTWFEKATRQQPLNFHFLANHANCLMFLGRLDEAQASLLEVLRIQPAYPTAHWMLSGLRKAINREHINEMEKLIAAGRYAPRDLAYMNYACGKELEDLEEWDNAFEAFAAGAWSRHKTVEYDEKSEIEMYTALERICTTEWLSEGPTGHDDPSPIFVVGQPRTGTTLVERIMTAHSRVCSAGEPHHFINNIRRLTEYRGQKRFSGELIELAASIDFKTLGEDYIQAIGDIETPHFVDKFPSNFLYVPFILKALPNAKIIHLRRDPMDACFSSFKQLFADAYPHSYDQKEMARHHARYVRLMSIWRERFGNRYHELEYEDVARKLEPKAQALIEFLGIPWEEACLEFELQKSDVATASAVQVRQPLHTRSIGRWRRYERQLQPMSDELKAHDVQVVFNAAN